MSNSDAVAAHGRPHLPTWRRFAGIVALYVLLGPLMGAVGVNGIFTVYAVSTGIVSGSSGDIARLFWGGMVVGTMVFAIGAYAFGSVSALAVGLAVALGDRRLFGVSWRRALRSAFVMWLLSVIVVLTVVPPEGQVQWIGGLLVAHLFAAAACTWIARRIFR
ncbi:hypothetical protein [Pelagibacterium sediminicola]|uniref:hypothetical protein n=1 Tax=Pelagibacterium sediminicola TaxID=2248761 RepID=UPI001300491D|nr:hypothetical protein [Pelagibacterium sediminicola]